MDDKKEVSYEEQKAKTLRWTETNLSEIADHISHKLDNVDKIGCVYIDEWWWNDENIVYLGLCHYISGCGSSPRVNIHNEDLDKFIAEYLMTKGQKVVDDLESQIYLEGLK